MQGFNKRKTTDTRNCSNCYQGIQHLARGLLCGYTDDNTRNDEVCGLYIARTKKEAVEEKQEELF